VIRLFFCAGNNRRFAEIAIACGLEYGAQLPTRVYYPIQFADQDWSKPHLASQYIEALRTHRPDTATVTDWERDDQYEQIMAMSEEVAAICETVIVIPKVIGGIGRIPHRIGNARVVLGRPVGTHSKTAPPVWEYGDRPVHLLGGTPQQQLVQARYLPNVVSADCSSTAAMARKRCAYWTEGRAATGQPNRYWRQMSEDGIAGKDAMYEAFRRSCVAYQRAWNRQRAGTL
jgi:hypothetical protein